MRVVLVLAFLSLTGVMSDMETPQCMSFFDYEHKLLYKLITIEEEVKKFRAFIDELKNNEERKVTGQIDKFEAAMAKFVNDTENAIGQLKVKSDKVVTDLEGKLAKFENDTGKKMSELREQKAKSDKVVEDLEGKLVGVSVAAEGLTKGPAVGFTLKKPTDSPTSSQLTFLDVITNVDDAFDVDTGVFTCMFPGYYYFAASLLKSGFYKDNAFCFISKNGAGLVVAFTSPSSYTSEHSGIFAAVNSVYVHLTKGDNVTLDRCTDASSFDVDTSFTGFLVTPDVV